MYKILTLNNIAAAGLERLPRQYYEVASEIRQPTAILVRSQDMHDYVVPASLLAVGRAGAGVNNIPVAAMTAQGIPVFNAPGGNANAVKELVLAGMLIACRNIALAARFVDGLDGDDETLETEVEAGKKRFAGFELPSRTLGVVGLGAIGVRVANAAMGLGMNVIGYDPDISVERAWQLNAGVKQAISVDELLTQSDFVTFHVPLIEATRDLVNAERLKRMRDGVVILNFARAGIVNDEAVCQAIDKGKVYAYVCDFPSNLLKRNPRVLSLPHLGASTREAEENCAVMVADQIREYLENGNVRNSVNFPNVRLRRSGEHRITVVNENRPDMVGQISHHLGLVDVNIEHMVNESRGGIAYTIMDLDRAVPPDTLQAIDAIDGVLRVRTI